ncbi:hypothetical protein ACWEFL_06130 [Streptomyces sp. NPDC004838]
MTSQRDLTMEFDAGGHSGVHRLGPRAFRTSPDPATGRYELPRLTLVSGDGAAWNSIHGLRIIEIRDAPPELTQWLENGWTYPGVERERILGRRVLDTPLSVPPEVLPPAPGTPVSGEEILACEIVWSVSYTTGAAPQTEPVRVPHTMTLEFVVPRPAADAGHAGPPDELYFLRRRVIADRNQVFPGFAAIDFGTTASAITLFDPRQDDQLPIDPGQERRLRELLADLLDGHPEGPPAAAADSWRAHLAELTALLTDRAVDERLTTPAALATRLRDGRPLPAGMLDLVCLELDKGLSSESEALSRWLALRLHDVYDDALNVPSLARQRLRQVEFGQSTTFIDSGLRMRLDNDGTPRFSLGARVTEEAGVCPDLKRFLGQTRQVGIPGLPPDHSLTTDYLYTHVYDDLLNRAEGFAAADRDREPRPLARIVVTHPTTTAPSAREALRALLVDALDATDVCVDYDEGVAAGLFFLLRDLGTDLGNGVEALRARSHPLDGGPRPSWGQSGLVVDIGGGTTDIALIRLTTEVRDPEPGDDAVPAAARGIHYSLAPEVIGSTGHSQLGGDFLTLLVYYWIKARIVDELLTGGEHAEEREALTSVLPDSLREPGGAPLPLTEAVLGYGLRDDVAPADVRQVLGDLLPSQWPEGDQDTGRRNPFVHLFTLAEKIKTTLGATGADATPPVVPQRFLHELHEHVFENQGRKAPYGKALFPAEGVPLDPAQFHRLMRPAVHRIAAIAADLVRDNLARLPGGRLDRVMLSGRSTMMPLVQEGIVEWFTGAVHDSVRLPWNAAALSRETRYAKEAASIGAAWAYSRKTINFRAVEEYGDGGGTEAIKSAAQRGLTEATVSTGNLFLGMPCNMNLMSANGQEPVFRTGEPFEELDITGRLGRHSAPFQPNETVFLQRATDRSNSVNWGNVDLVDHARREKFTPGAAMWDRIRARVEVDHQLNPVLLVFLGREHHLTEGEYFDLVPRLGEDPREEWPARNLPWAVHAETAGGGSTEIFPAGPLGGDEPAQLHETPDPHTPPVAGAMALLPPPLDEDPDGYRFFRFHAVEPDGTRHLLGEAKAPGDPGPTAVHRASLTATGRLRVHRGRVPFLPAKDLRDVHERPGAVRRLPMNRSEPSLNEMWNPYSGRH